MKEFLMDTQGSDLNSYVDVWVKCRQFEGFNQKNLPNP